MAANGGADVACGVAGPDGDVVAVLPLLLDDEEGLLLLVLLLHPAARPTRAANTAARARYRVAIRPW
jgi:hypothetical protein